MNIALYRITSRYIGDFQAQRRHPPKGKETRQSMFLVLGQLRDWHGSRHIMHVFQAKFQQYLKGIGARYPYLLTVFEHPLLISKRVFERQSVCFQNAKFPGKAADIIAASDCAN